MRDICLNGTTFRSTEHYLFHEKALKIGDAAAAEEIFKAPAAGKAKKLGDALQWDSATHGPWHPFAYNGKKYDYHADLWKTLFETAPLTLVEASPHDVYWDVGLSVDDSKI